MRAMKHHAPPYRALVALLATGLWGGAALANSPRPVAGSTQGTFAAGPTTAPGVPIASFGLALPGADISSTLAVAFASTVSPTVIFPSGVFTFQPTSLVAGSAVSLIGQGAGQTVLQLPGSGCSVAGAAAILSWVSRSNITIRNLTIDLNNCAGPIGGGSAPASVVAITGGGQVHFDHAAVVNMGTGKWLEISLNGVSHVWVDHNYLHATAAQTIQNQGLNISSSYTLGDDVHFEDNTLVNTGALANASHFKARGNDISGWAYGAGISTNPTASPDAQLVENLIHDSATGVDQDGAYPTGIEGWGQRQQVVGNTISNVAAACIFVGGPSQNVTGNRCQGAGKRADGVKSPGIQIGYVNSTQNGNGSALVGNTVIDDGTGTTTYGYADQTGVNGVYAPLASNAFAGALGAMNIVAGTTAGGGPGCGIAGTASPTPSTSACQYGVNNQAPGTFSAVGGQWNTAQGLGSVVHGSFGQDRYRTADIFAAGQNSANGDSQAGRHVLHAVTTSTTAKRLTTDGSGTAGPSNCVNLPTLNFPANQQAIYGLAIRVVATDITTPGNFLHFYDPAGTLSRVTTVATTGYTPSGSTVNKMVGTVGTLTITADTTNACLAVTWTAPNADTWHVVARIDDLEAF
jgi:hypothetical protein